MCLSLFGYPVGIIQLVKYFVKKNINYYKVNN